VLTTCSSSGAADKSLTPAAKRYLPGAGADAGRMHYIARFLTKNLDCFALHEQHID
jgi:hypothetical protein